MFIRPRNFIFAAASSLALAACGMQGQDNEKETDKVATAETTPDYGYQTYADDNLADSMASNDAEGSATATGADAIPDPEERPIMQAQVVLDRKGFGPGVVDGEMGMSTENALRGFQQANDLDVTGKLDAETKAALEQWDRIPATRVVKIPADWGQKDYYEIPDDPAEQAKMQRLGYTSLDEKLAERFHTTVDVLKQLNPGGKPAGMKAATSSNSSGATTQSPTSTPTPSPTSSQAKSESESGFTPTQGPKSFFAAGQQIRVPNVGADRIAPGSVDNRDWQRTLASLGVGTDQPEVDRVVVSKKGDTLKAYQGGKLVALFTVTSGSEHDPLPLGNWKITGISHNPPFSYDPDLFWDVPDTDEDQQLPPGPNGPVGVVWIDLSKEHYGIHGTAEPQTIGRAQSHGCVRLTNWDAARLAQMVSQSTKVIFEA